MVKVVIACGQRNYMYNNKKSNLVFFFFFWGMGAGDGKRKFSHISSGGVLG